MKAKTVMALCDNGWREIKKSELKPGQSYQLKSTIAGMESTLFTCYRPPKPKTMSPVKYYKLYKVVPEKYTNVVNGRYYCNPAHCSKSWKNKKQRDEHLDCAYGILD